MFLVPFSSALLAFVVSRVLIVLTDDARVFIVSFGAPFTFLFMNPPEPAPGMAESSREPALSSFDWRVHYVLSSDTCASYKAPFLRLSLFDEKRRQYDAEFTKTELDSLIASLDDVLHAVDNDEPSSAEED